MSVSVFIVYITRVRFRLPARMRGCGFRCRQRLANAAFVSCMVEVAEVMVDRSTVDGRVEGYFQALLPTLGAASFDAGGSRFETFLAGSTLSAEQFESAWRSLQGDVEGSTVGGPLDHDADQAGVDRAQDTHLQREITRQREQVWRDTLHADMLALPRTDTRRQAWMAVDRLSSPSSAWVPSWPTA